VAVMAAHEGEFPRARWAAWLCAGYLIFAFFETVPWSYWDLPDLRPIALPPPDKTTLAPLRLIHILALAYLLFSSPRVRRVAGARVFRPLDVCGRHSLEVFAVGCVAALLGRLVFRTYGPGLIDQVAINLVGFIAMWTVALYLDARQASGRHAPPPQARPG
ncbi:MAG TPA: OpgC domain-containing protein, partial [Xanthobacteraceae bacterium]|nr:OpgC domain-containing protein [Xanthobacteraceae bacterium]